MNSTWSDKPTVPNEATADRRLPGTPPGRIRDLTLVTTTLGLLAAWSVYRGLKHPDHRQHDLLWAVLCVLYAVSAWVHRATGGRLAPEPNGSFRRTIVALGPLFALALIALDYTLDMRRQTAAGG